MKRFIQRVFGEKKQEPEKSDVSLILGVEQLRRQGDLDGAIQLAKQYLSKHPKDLNMHDYLGNLYTDLGRYDDALNVYQAISDIDPEYEGHYAGLAVTHFNLGDCEKAVGEFLIAIEENPLDPHLRFLLARCLFKTGRFEEAIYEYENSKPFHPNKELVHFGIGEAYFEQGKIDEAIEEFQHSIEIAPDEGEIHFRLAQCYEKQGNQLQADREFQVAKNLGY